MRSVIPIALAALSGGCGSTPVGGPIDVPIEVLAASNQCETSGEFVWLSNVSSTQQLSEQWPQLARGLGEKAWPAGGAVVIGLGQKPTPGYGLHLPDKAPLEGGKLELEGQFTKPPPGRMLAQVITYPCYLVGWPDPGAAVSSVRLSDADSGRAWTVNR